MSAKQPRISSTALAEVEAALRDYAKEVLRAGLGEFATNMYIDKADYFVRWLKNEFEPGSRGQQSQRRPTAPPPGAQNGPTSTAD